MNSSTLPRWERPIFVTSVARSGSTLLLRLLNLNPDITVWGEHGGMLKGITATIRDMEEESHVRNMTLGVSTRDSVIGELSDKETFSPWVSPFEAHEVREAMRDTIVGLLTRGLTPEIRWGFKEIRYGEPELRTMMELFPEAHLIVLARDVADTVASRFFSWGFTPFDPAVPEERAAAQAKVNHLMRHWINRYGPVVDLANEMPARCSLVRYEDLILDSDRITRLFGELGESVPSSDALAQVFSARSGSSFAFKNGEKTAALRQEVRTMTSTADYDRAQFEKIAEAFGLHDISPSTT